MLSYFDEDAVQGTHANRAMAWDDNVMFAALAGGQLHVTAFLMNYAIAEPSEELTSSAPERLLGVFTLR